MDFASAIRTPLAKISQDELKEWYRTHYSANLMHLVVYSSKDRHSGKRNTPNLLTQVKNSEKHAHICADPCSAAAELEK